MPTSREVQYLFKKGRKITLGEERSEKERH
jgi:hypothetical protein